MTSRQDWIRREVELIVDDYFDMLGAELRGEPFNKAQHNAMLLLKLNGRSRGSIEFKHCNISSVLKDAGRPFIDGYKPRPNAQRGLLDEVIDNKWNSFIGANDQGQQKIGAIAESSSRSNQEVTDWLSDVASCVDELGPVFTLADVYGFESNLSSMHPESNSIRPKIRQTLQRLRDLGALRFVDNSGNYTKTDAFPAGVTIIHISSDDSEDPFEHDSSIPDDTDEKYLRPIRKRRGAPRFRRALLRIYDQQCAITGDGPVDVLEAAHIEPHAVRGRNSLDNGLLLRADIHTLFDLGLLKIEPISLCVQVHEKLRSTVYEALDGQTLRPRIDGSTPNAEYLQFQFNRPVRVRLE